jgi:zinc transport system ATP-binding protein
VGYGGRALRGPLDLEIHSGEFWGVVGRNGSGKSTWIRTLIGLLPPVAGRVEWAVPDPSPVYVAQDSRFDAIYPISAHDVVAMAGMRGWSFLPTPRAVVDITGSLARLGVSELESRAFRELSAGQRQQVLFARAWASARDLVVLDEPTSAMDAEAEGRAFELMAELCRERGAAVIVIGHDHALLGQFTDRVLDFGRDRNSIAVRSAEELLASRRRGNGTGALPE